MACEILIKKCKYSDTKMRVKCLLQIGDNFVQLGRVYALIFSSQYTRAIVWTNSKIAGEIK